MNSASPTPVLLVVDDDDDVLEILTILLEDHGYAVVTAGNGKQALAQLEGGLRPKLILLDLMMPEMNGWQLYDRLQLAPELKEIPLVVLTASGLNTGVLGAVRVLPKPVEYERLLATIKDLALPSS